MAPAATPASLQVSGDKTLVHFWLSVVAIVLCVAAGAGSLVWIGYVIRRNFSLVDPLAPLYQRVMSPPWYLHFARLLNFGRPVPMSCTRLYALQARLERLYRRKQAAKKAKTTASAHWQAFMERLQSKFTPSLPSSMTASSSFQCAGSAQWPEEAHPSTTLARPQPAVLKDGKRVSSSSPTNYNFVPALQSMNDLGSESDSSCDTPTVESSVPSIVVCSAPDVQQSSFVDISSPVLSSLPVSPAVKYLGIPFWTMDEEDSEEESRDSDSDDWQFAGKNLASVLEITLPMDDLPPRPCSPLQPIIEVGDYPDWL